MLSFLSFQDGGSATARKLVTFRLQADRDAVAAQLAAIAPQLTVTRCKVDGNYAFMTNGGRAQVSVAMSLVAGETTGESYPG